MLYDNHGRLINYMRIAVTDRCNLRCFYCMPENGIRYVHRKDLLSFEELERVVSLFAQEGISKIRITGGEPFLRKGMMDFLGRISAIKGVEQIHITTNGTLTNGLIGDLKALGIKSINLSIDSLDKKRFHEITRRDSFDQVMATFHELLAHDMKVKTNMVVMNGKNIEDILPMINLTKEHKVSVRFIEEMPFNGTGKNEESLFWSQDKILEHIQSAHPAIEKLPDPPHSTSFNYQIPNHKGTVGIIAAYTRLFCGTCNRIRLTPQGTIKTCLYDDGVFNIRDLIREGATDEELIATLRKALNNRAKDGWEAEKNRKAGNDVSESMATIGG